MRAPRTCLLVVLVAILLMSTPAFGETFFVNNVAGNDLNSGLVETNAGEGAGPLRTIRAALRRTYRGDRIVLAKTDVPYHECLTLQGPNHSGTSYAPFVIDGGGAILDGTAPVPAEDWESLRNGIFRFTPERGGYQQLFLDGELAESMPRFDGSYLTSFLKPKQWCRCRGGIQFAAEKDKTPNSYDLRYAKHRVGITLYDVENVVIRNLTVRGFKLDGINAHDNAMNCVLSKVDSRANGRSGFSVGGASRLEIADCVAEDNGMTEFRSEGWSKTQMLRTKLVARQHPIWTRETNLFGRGPSLTIDGELQSKTNHWLPSARSKPAPAKPEAPPQPQDDPFGDDQS